MLDYDQKRKLKGDYNWDTPQEKADFNKNMRKKLERWLKEVPIMIEILKGLPPRVKSNAKLEDDLPNLIEFVDIFLETINPLPVGIYKNGEKRVFRNVAVDAKTHPSYEHWKENNIFFSASRKEYIIRTDAWTAFPAEILRHNLLEKHVKKMQRYTDPSTAIAINYERLLEFGKLHDIHTELLEKARVLGPCEASCQWLQSNELIPTNPFSTPKIIESEPDDQG